MDPQTGRVEQVYPNHAVYAAAIDVCEKTGRVDKALALFEHARLNGPHFPQPLYPDERMYFSAIRACENWGQTDWRNWLLKNGIVGEPGKPETAVFKFFLGFEFGPSRNLLNLHQGAVLKKPRDRKAHDFGVPPSVAHAIFQCLLHPPEILMEMWAPHFKPFGLTGINRRTSFIVGHRGQDVLKNLLRELMSEQGWNPQHAVQNGKVNPGCLVSRPPPVPLRATAQVFQPEQSWGGAASA